MKKYKYPCGKINYGGVIMVDKPSEIGFIIVGAIFIWIGYTFLAEPSSSSLTTEFLLYAGSGFVLAGIVGIIGGALSLLRH